MSGVLSLASRLALLDVAELTAVIRAAQPAAPASIADPLDLATALLRPEPLRRALSRAPRRVVTALAHPALPESAPGLREAASLGLAGAESGAPQSLPEVEAALAELLAEAGLSPDDLRAETPPETPLAAIAGDTWPERAFERVRAATSALRALQEEPGLFRANRNISAGTLKAVALAAQLDPEEAQPLLEVLGNAGLLRAAEDALGARRLVATPLADDWLLLPRAERWLDLARAHLAAMPGPLRAAVEAFPAWGWPALAAQGVRWRTPLIEAAPLLAIESFVARAEAAGLLDSGAPTPPVTALLAGEESAAELAAAAFPATIRQLYVQPDLSIVAPGPLEPELEEQLVRFALPELSGLASTYRVSRFSLERALSRGGSEAEIRSFLAACSLTGVPQPLDYLLTEVAARHGSIVVTADEREGGRALVRTKDEATLKAMLVDSGLRHLGLEQHDGTSARSRFHPEQLRSALREARFPVAAAPAAETPRPAASPAAEPAPTAPADPVAELAARVHLAARQHPAAGDFERLVQLAARDRARLAVTVQAGGVTRTFRLLPSGVKNGRLRGVDEQAEVERTLPLDQVISVELL